MKGVEFWYSFVSPKWLKTKSLYCWSGRLDDFLPILILVEIENLRCLSPFGLRNTKDSGVLPFAILLDTEERCCDVDGRDLPSIDGFKLDIKFSSLPSLASSAVMYCTSDCLSICHRKIFIG